MYYKSFSENKLRIITEVLAGIVVLIIIGTFSLKLLYNSVVFSWTTDERTKYNECEKFGKVYPCNLNKPGRGTYSPQVGIGGCQYLGIWIKDTDLTLFKVKKDCWM